MLFIYLNFFFLGGGGGGVELNFFLQSKWDIHIIIVQWKTFKGEDFRKFRDFVAFCDIFLHELGVWYSLVTKVSNL